MTVLSQNTSDANTDRAFRRLKQRFPTWDQVADAPEDEIAEAIRPGGLAAQKAPRIKGILSEIEEREGSIGLSALEKMDDQEVVGYLCSLPGVGPKTAACVLVFSLGRAAFPVDTHVNRVAGRLGWVPEGSTAEKTHVLVAPRVPEGIRYELHMALIEHGRRVCRARFPRCRECVLFDLCPAGPRFVGTEVAG